MNTGSSGNSAICARVERTLATNRKAKLGFPGVFMDVIGHELDEDRMRLQFYDDPLFREGRGELSWVAAGVLADLALGGVTRPRRGRRVRPATVHSALQMSGAPVLGNCIGHVHGGVLFGAVASVPGAATRPDMRLSNLSACFLAPGLPPRLDVPTRSSSRVAASRSCAPR